MLSFLLSFDYFVSTFYYTRNPLAEKEKEKNQHLLTKESARDIIVSSAHWLVCACYAKFNKLA